MLKRKYEFNLFSFVPDYKFKLIYFYFSQVAGQKAKKPSFFTRLMDRTASQGSTVKLTCTVSSHPEPTTKWLKDGTAISLLSSDKYRSKFQDGVSSLEVANLELGDSGNYTCLAQNELGEASTSCTLKVYGGYEPVPFPPTFTRPIRERYQYSEDQLTLECRVRSEPTPKVTWMKNGSPLKSSNRYLMSERKDGLCTLTIYHPEPDDSGEYVCKAENSVSSASYSHYVSFSGRDQYMEERKAGVRAEGRRMRENDFPRFHLGLTDNKFPIGGTIALQVELKGTPRDVKWLRGNEELPRASSRIRSFEESGVYTLLVSNASEKEAGTYTCRAYSYHDHSHVESTASIQVLPPSMIRDGKPPKILNKPTNMVVVTVEDDVFFTCRVTGNPKPRVTWLKGVKDISITERTMVEHTDDYYKFTLKRVVPADAGTYWIVAKNMNGSDRAFITVQVSIKTNPV